MANMESVERAGSYFNTDIGRTAGVKAQTKTANKAAEQTKATEKTLKETVEKHQQGGQISGKGKETKEVTPQQLKEAVEKANKQAKMSKTRLEFTYVEDVNRYSVKVKDKETDEVIREYPSEDSLKALENIWKLAGIIVDESV